MLDKINITQLMEKAWANASLRQEFATQIKAVIGRETGEIIPDVIDIKLLQENPKLIWIVVPPKPSNWPNITEIPDEPHLKPNEFSSQKERVAAVKAAFQKGEIGLPQVLRAVIQSYVTEAAWGKDGFLQELLSDCRTVVKKAIADKKLPLELPDDLEIRALEETATRRYMTLPTDPGLSEPIGFERAITTPYTRGTSHRWYIANSNAWGYTVSRHGITLPFCGAFVALTTDENDNGRSSIGDFKFSHETLSFVMSA
jgi:hypothetical protein